MKGMMRDIEIKEDDNGDDGDDYIKDTTMET